MRESIGSTWIFMLVISFTFIFTGFLVLSLNYSKAYKIKNEVTSIIEKYEGLTNADPYNNKGSIKIINQYLSNSGYNSKGACQIGDYAAHDLYDYSLTEITNTNNKEKFYYCITIEKNNNCTTTFYVKIFYDFNLPILGQLQKQSITGHTTELYNAYLIDEVISC